MNLFLFSLFFTFLPLSSLALERIWLIRHCDKPKDHNNPCCSDKGYIRANSWHYYFLPFWNSHDTVKIITSSFNEKKICLPHVYPYSFRETGNTCQKSQRMWITGYYLYNNLYTTTVSNLLSKINSDYCIGQYKDMLHHVLERNYVKKTSDLIIVWEHNEIIDIIHHFDIPIEKWKNKNIYDLIFMIDVSAIYGSEKNSLYPKKAQLFYDCYSLDYDDNTCQKKTEKWLHTIKKITDYRRPIPPLTLMATKIKLPLWARIVGLLFFFSIFCFFCVYVCFCNTKPKENIVLYSFSKDNHPYISI
jgi:hypothetical protein